MAMGLDSLAAHVQLFAGLDCQQTGESKHEMSSN